MSAPLNVGQVLSARARLQPAGPGARDLNRSMTNLEWNRRACRLANALLGLGLSKGDRVAVLAYNRVEWAEIYIAVAKAGLVAVPINFRLTPEEALYIIEDSGALAILVEDVLGDAIEQIRERTSIGEDRFVMIGSGAVPTGYTAYEDLLAKGADSEPTVTVSPEDAWCIMYTSGTTGRPKGAIRNHHGIAMLAFMTGVELSIVREEDALLVMPMCHANSLYFFASYLFCWAGISVFSRSSFDPGLCLRTMGEQGTTFTSLVPTHYTMMLDVPAAQRGAYGFERVAKLMISSAPARAGTKRDVMEMFPNSGLYELYGSTEAGWVTMLHPNEQFDKLGTVGREVVGSEPVRLIGEDGAEVPDGEPGELFSFSPSNFTGYWNLPEQTAAAFRGNHVSVGDMAVRGEDGFIRLIDRKNNLIISGGENIYPSEVETVLAAHAAVSDVAVIGRPDDKWGETVEAVVIVRSGETVSEDELVAWARTRLAGYKRPRHIRFIAPEDMPRNATGKILHRILRERLSTDNTGDA